MYLTGFHAIEERIKSGGAGAGPLLVAKAGPRARELLALAASHKIRVDRVGTFDLDRIASDHRGIALEVSGPGEGGTAGGTVGTETTVEAFLARLGPAGGPNALVLVLDEITDPHNYGAILRSCDQFGVDLVISRRRRTAKHAEIIAQTSAGAAAWVPAAETANLVRTLEQLKEAGFWIYGADMDGEPVYSKDLRGRVALALGGEGTGLSRLLREACDGMVAVPSGGRIDSLNVSVAAGILLYEIRRQQGETPKNTSPRPVRSAG
ncbi:MAG: 23S rRNA (guanosine(2251)-2'-O)-methyltransferase RlmB [Treponema sp.]|jgi:23S rRNA (guanosine2251-2'-O)-methyltransferase|nr:23S rRNA (guanosine(2251)-2'-O)-methyltransferase RlmB [Treponema sp.]